MIKEDYCSYEVAKLLKEKGFDFPCIGRYSIRSKEFHLDSTRLCNNGGLFECAAPSQSMAMKWLREVHGIFIGIQPYDSYYENKYEFEISVKQNNSYEWDFKDVENSLFEGYENTVEAALKYCLENLI